jgi:hypothetical protein
LLVLDEKHGHHYFLVNNDADLARVSLSILAGRNKAGYWYGEPGEKPQPHDFTEESIAKLPASLQKAARSGLADYEARLRRYEAEVEAYAEIKAALDAKDGMAAYRALRSRSDYEYEGMEIKTFSETYLG